MAKCEMDFHLYEKVNDKDYKHKDFHVYKVMERRMGDCWEYTEMTERKHVGYTFFNKDSAYRIRDKELRDPKESDRFIHK